MIQPNKTWRYEKKALLTNISHHELINFIKHHPYHFVEAYPKRYINNIYFDDEQLSHYNANINGISYRTKLRLRWYGDVYGNINPSLEIKIKSGELGTKIYSEQIPLDLPIDFSGNDVKQLLKPKEYVQRINEMLCRTEPKIMNRYLRHYFISIDKLFRITVDSDVSFKRICNSCGLNTPSKMREALIFELKYDQKSEAEAHNITGYFPFRLTKSSKYIAGIQKTYPCFINDVNY